MHRLDVAGQFCVLHVGTKFIPLHYTAVALHTDIACTRHYRPEGPGWGILARLITLCAHARCSEHRA